MVVNFIEGVFQITSIKMDILPDVGDRIKILGSPTNKEYYMVADRHFIIGANSEVNIYVEKMF